MDRCHPDVRCRSSRHRRFDDRDVLFGASAADTDAGDHLALAGEWHAAAHRGVSTAGDGEEGIAVQVAVGERLLATEEESVHLPEAPLPRRRLGGERGGEGVRMDRGQREVPEGEPDVELRLDALDRPERLARIRALMVAVLEDQPRARGAADVIDRLLDRLDWHLTHGTGRSRAISRPGHTPCGPERDATREHPAPPVAYTRVPPAAARSVSAADRGPPLWSSPWSSCSMLTAMSESTRSSA